MKSQGFENVRGDGRELKLWQYGSTHIHNFTVSDPLNIFSSCIFPSTRERCASVQMFT